MVIESELTLKKYRNFCFAYMYEHPLYRMLTLYAVIMIFFLFFDTPDNSIIFSVQLISIIIILVVLPLRILRNSDRRYEGSKLLNGKRIYEFTDNIVSVRGESFKSEYHWENVTKMKELKNWIVIFFGKRSGFVIPKEVFGDNFEEFKRLVRGKIRAQKPKESQK